MFATTTLAFGMPGTTEWIVIALIGLLIFGRRLPEVGRALGRSIVEFKKGVKGIEDEIEEGSAKSEKPLDPYDKRLGGDEEELRRLQSRGVASSATTNAGETTASTPKPASDAPGA
ncbi:MAG: twin-arginine translocase TatA/TatE family subunit [Phycisphaerales bacterium]